MVAAGSHQIDQRIEPKSAWGLLRYEAIAWPIVAGLALIILNQRAFDNFFFGEDFITRTLYLDANNNLIGGILTPFGIGSAKFFRPTAIVWSMATQLVLPWDPWLHHLRNLVLSLINIVVLHRVLLQISDRPEIRLLALLFFSVSAIHFTIIGLINCVDNAGTLLLTLVMALFTLRALRSGRASDTVLALLFYASACFARDYSLVVGVFLVTAAAVPDLLVKDSVVSLRWRRGFASGTVAVAAAYLLVRTAIAGWPRPGEGGTGYGMSLDIAVLSERVLAFVGIVFNLPVVERYRDALGFGVFNRILPEAIARSPMLAGSLLAVCLLVTIATIIAAMRRNRRVIAVLLWPTALVAPPLLIANMQPYYAYEGAAFAAVALAVLLTQARDLRRYLVPTWAAIVCLMCAAHALADARPTDFWWGRHSAAVAALDRDVLSKHRGQQLSRLTVITPDATTALFWRYLTDPPPFKREALITELLRSDHQMDVRFEAMTADARAVALLANRSDAPVYALAGTAFRRIEPPLVPEIERFDTLPRHIWKSWMSDTELDWSIAAPPVAHDGNALRIDLRARSDVQRGVGGVRLLPSPGSFALDVYLEVPTDLAGILVYLTDPEGAVVGGWSANFKASPQPAGWNVYRFTPGQDNDAGFRWQPPGKPGHPVALDIIFQLDGGGKTTVYLDSVRRE